MHGCPVDRETRDQSCQKERSALASFFTAYLCPSAFIEEFILLIGVLSTVLSHECGPK